MRKKQHDNSHYDSIDADDDRIREKRVFSFEQRKVELSLKNAKLYDVVVRNEKKKRFYPDLNWGRWIQSPKC